MRSVFTAWLGSRAAVCVALASVVFAGRAWLLGVWGTPLPIADQWDVEAALYRAWLTDTLHVRDLFAAHNEHRIVLTRLADLALFLVNGGWNPWAQLLLNAGLHAATAAALLAAFQSPLTRGRRALLAFGVATVFVAPAGWQNALWGFQSQVYFTNFFTIVALATLAFSPPATRRWWLGWAALLLGLFGNAGGLLAALAALALVWPQRNVRPSWVAIAAVLSAIALGVWLSVSVPAHASLRAQNISQFFAVFCRTLSWPHIDSAWPWLVLQLPIVALCLRRWHNQQPLDAAERCALALALCAVLQAVAVAYSRGGGLLEFRPLSRYQDPLFLGAATQLFAALRLTETSGRPARLLALGWCGLAAVGLLQLTIVNFTLHLPYKRDRDREALAQVRAYLAAADARVFSDQPAIVAVHPDHRVVMRVLDDAALRPILPRALFEETLPPFAVIRAPILLFTFVVFLGVTLAASPRRVELTAGGRADNPPIEP